MTKSSYEEVDYRCVQLVNLCKSAEEFCETWTTYLMSVGWSEIEFELETEKRIFDARTTN